MISREFIAKTLQEVADYAKLIEHVKALQELQRKHQTL
jgi:hypothetical protein